MYQENIILPWEHLYRLLMSKFTNVKSIIFDDDDDDVQPIVTKFVNPFANYLVSPDVLKGKEKC